MPPAQSRRLQPVLRASETAAPPASVQKLRLRRVCLFSVIRHRGMESQSAKVGATLGSGLEADLLTGPSWLFIYFFEFIKNYREIACE